MGNQGKRAMTTLFNWQAERDAALETVERNAGGGRSPYYKAEGVTLYLAECEDVRDQMQNAPAVFLDPPFDKWNEVKSWPNKTKVCFTNWQNRAAVEKLFGVPRCEIVWHFRDGRWVSHNMPRITHETILIYGPTGSAYVGEMNADRTPRNKGNGCVGRDKLAERIYTPRERKALNSVLEYPRNVSGEMGCWGKPVALMRDLLAWLDVPEIADPYAGACSASVAARELGIRVIASERDEETCRKAAHRLTQSVLSLGGKGAEHGWPLASVNTEGTNPP